MQKVVYLLVIIILFFTGCGGDSDTGSTDDNGAGMQNNPDAPVLASIGNREINPDSNLAINLSATDANGDNLVYTTAAVGSPNIFGLSNPAVWDGMNGVLTWTPTINEEGEYQVRFTATDDSMDSLSDSETITISVMGPITIGRQLYESNCQQCHGVGQNSQKKCAEPESIQDAIDNNDGGMNNLSGLSSIQVSNISAYLIDVGGNLCVAP